MDELNDTTQPGQDELDNNNVEQNLGTDAAATGADGSDGVGDEIKIPEHWPQEFKDHLTSLTDKELKKAVFGFVKGADDRYQKKFNDDANARKVFESERKEFDISRGEYNTYKNLEKSLGDDAPAIVARYGNAANYFNSLRLTDKAYSQDPIGFAANLLIAHGIDSTDQLQERLSSPEAQRARAGAATPPQMSQQDIAKLVAEELNKAKAQDSFTSFVSSKDEAGNPKYPHFDKVRPMMASLSQAMPGKPIEEIYEMALYADPELRATMEAAKEQEKAKQKAAELAKAKAAASVGGASKSGTQQKAGSDDALSKALDGLSFDD
jgi:hypothetical protein